MEGKIDLIKGVKAESIETGKIDEQIKTAEGQFVSEALNDDEKINSLMTSSKPEVTILVGFEGFGKTSFAASCYQILLQSGSIDGYVFYDSETLTGFERRLFLRRLCEGTEDCAPETRRTIRGEPYLLTMHLEHPEKGEKLVILSDHSGEDYGEYADKKRSIDGDILIMHADRIIFFLDASKISSTDYLSVKNRYVQLLTNMKESSVFGRKELKTDLLFTKFDLVEKALETYKQRKAEMEAKFRSIIGRDISKVFEIQANKANDNKPLMDLFVDIIENTVTSTPVDAGDSGLDWVKEMIRMNN